MLLCFPKLISKIYSAESYGFELEQKPERLRFIPIHRLHSSLGQPLCKALPAFHALTGCDSTSALQGIGKTTALKILLKDNQFQQQLSHFGAGPAVSNELLVSSEAFICYLYHRGGRLTKADEVQYLLFF